MTKLCFLIVCHVMLYIHLFFQGCDSMHSFFGLKKFSHSQSSSTPLLADCEVSDISQIEDFSQTQSSSRTQIGTDIKVTEQRWNKDDKSLAHQSSSKPIVEDHKKAKKSWDKLFKMKEQYLGVFAELENDYCQVLQSKPEVLGQKLVIMWNNMSLNELATQTVKHLTILNILHYIGKNHTLNPMANQVILSQLGKMEDSNMIVLSPITVTNLMKHTKEFYVKKLTEHIQGLRNNSEIKQFVSMQKSLGEHGLQLVRDWDPVVAKEVLLLWTSSITPYSWTSPQIRAIVETQVAYISLIERNYNLLKYGFTFEKSNQPELYEKLNTYRGEIIDYIDSLDESSLNEYFVCQRKIPRFHIRSFGNLGSKPVLKFWTNYMSLYIEARGKKVLEDYAMLVEDLALSHTKTISEHLDSFLNTVKGFDLEGTEPLIIQFVEYLHNTVDSQRSQRDEKRTREEVAELRNICAKCENLFGQIKNPY